MSAKLKNVVERSVYRHGSSEHPLDEIIIDPFSNASLPNCPRPPYQRHSSRLDLPLKLREFQLQQEKALLQRSLQQAKFNQKRAADLLALTYHQFRALLKKHQL
nr:transcriptional regulator [Salmonella sp. NCTC 7297]